MRLVSLGFIPSQAGTHDTTETTLLINRAMLEKLNNSTMFN